MSALEPVQLEYLREIGERLKQAREAKGMALDDVSAKTLIRPGIIKAIEEGDARPLPEPVYLRGFIRRYGDLLGLSGTELADNFPWKPSEAVPSTFVAAAVTTVDSVDEPRRPFSAPRSEAREVVPDPVLPEEDTASAPVEARSESSLDAAPHSELPVAGESTPVGTPPEPATPAAEVPAAEASSLAIVPQPAAEIDAPSRPVPQPFPTAPPAAERGGAAVATVANPAVATPERQGSGLPPAIIGAILAGVGLLAAIAFAIGNRTPKTATNPNETAPADTTEQVSEAPAAEQTAPEVAPVETSETPAEPAVTSETASAETPDPAEPAEPEAVAPAPGETALTIEVKDEAAWFYVQVDGFVVYEGIASDFKESFKGKEVMLGTSRPDLLQVAVNGGAPKAFGAIGADGTIQEKTETFTAATP